MHNRPPNAPPPRVRPARRATACLLAALCTAAASAAAPMSFADLNAGLARAAADFVAAKAACDKLAGNPRDVCREQARAQEMVTRAELELARAGTPKARDYLAAIKLDTAYDVARTQCNDKTGEAKTHCTREAQATRTQGQADLKLRQRTMRARSDGADGRREAADEPAAQKCDATAAEVRAACAAAAKAAKAKAGKT